MMMAKRSENFKRDGFGLLSHLSRESGEGKDALVSWKFYPLFMCCKMRCELKAKKNLLSSSSSAQPFIHRFYR